MGYGKLLIGVTGNAMDVDVRDYEEAGADCVLIKPMRMEHLEKLLQYCTLYGCQSSHPLIERSQKASNERVSFTIPIVIIIYIV